MPAAASATEFPAQDDFHSFTVDEVAERLRLSSRSVVRLVDEGELKSLHRRRRGTPLRITARSLREYFERADGE